VRLPHGFVATPTAATLNVTRRRRGGAFVVGDFSAQPLRLHNYSGGELTDQGSNGVALVNNGGAVVVAGADGGKDGAYGFAGGQSLSATDTGLPSALAPRSYGCWFKTTNVGTLGLLAWGASFGDVRLVIEDAQGLIAWSGATATGGAFVSDGRWHHAVVVEDAAATDGVQLKLYLDGRLMAGSGPIGAIALTGANRFRVGARADATAPFVGQLDGAFVCGFAIDATGIARLYAKGFQSLLSSPKNPGDHVEAWDGAAVYATFDTLETTALVDLGVSA
jgi:hypothetical protein